MAAFSGAFPHDLLDLNHWRWQGPVKENGELGKEGDRKAVSVPSDEADTSTMEKFGDDPWFVLVTESPGAPYVRLRSPAKGSTTSSSSTTRSELREMHEPHRDSAAKWDATTPTVHNLKVRLAVAKVMEKDAKRSRVAVAQVHKTSEHGIIVFFDGEQGQLRWKQNSPVQSGSLGNYRLGDYVNIGLSVRDGICKIYVNDVEKAQGKVTGDGATTCYFKTGCYNQDNNRDDGYPEQAFNEVHIAAVRAKHDEPWAPGGYDPIGPGVGATEEGEPEDPKEPQIGATGSKPRDLIQFNGPKQAWKLNLDINDAGKHTGKKGGSVETSAKALVDGFVHDGHFDVVDDGRAVRFRSHLNGATTGGSSYPRTELREMKPGDPTKKAEWNPADGTVRRLTAQVKVTHAPSTPEHKRVSIGQIHGGDDDLLQIMYDAEKKAVGYTWPDDDGEGRWKKNLIQNYTLGTWFTYRIEAGGGTVRIFIDGQEKAAENDVDSPKCYFKAGAYTQSSVIKQPDTAKPDDFGEAVFRSIVVGS